MKIARVKILNLLGIEELEFTPGKAFNEISGGNNQNKTNLLNAIKSVIEGGHDATLLRAGAERGEIVLEIDDGTEIKKSVTQKDSRLQIKRNDTVLPQPMTTLQTIMDEFSVNPVKFLTATRKDRAQVLLEAMPIPLDLERLETLAEMELPKFQPSMPPLTVINMVRQTLFDNRTGIHRTLEDKRGTIKQLNEALPEIPDGRPGDVNLTEDEIDQQIDAINARQQEEMSGVDAKLMAWMEQKDLSAADISREIEDLQRQIEERRVELGKLDSQASGAKVRAAEKKSIIQSALATERSPLETQRNALRTNRTMAAKREVTLENIARLTQEVTGLETEWARYTSILGNIDGYKMELLENLPIKNLEVIDGEIKREGIPFDRLNHAQRTAIAIELAKLRSKQLGFVCVDGLELMDPDAFESFREQAVASGLQFFVTRVGRGELTIERT